VARAIRIPLLLVVLIVLTATAGAFAFNGEGNPGASPERAGDNTERIVERLGAAGVTTDADELQALADVYGVGGAVRILAWAEAASIDPSEITAMRDEGMGWGQIGQALEDEHPGTEFTPGIGGIMGGGNPGQGQGQGKPDGAGSDESGETDTD
jgi:hypothetical protein